MIKHCIHLSVDTAGTVQSVQVQVDAQWTNSQSDPLLTQVRSVCLSWLKKDLHRYQSLCWSGLLFSRTKTVSLAVSLGECNCWPICGVGASGQIDRRLTEPSLLHRRQPGYLSSAIDFFRAMSVTTSCAHDNQCEEKGTKLPPAAILHFNSSILSTNFCTLLSVEPF